MKITGIYKIESTISNKIYIGSALDISKRWRGHLSKLRKNKHLSKIQNHVNKYGIEDLKFSILEECDKESLLDREQYYLDALLPWFNSRKKADNNIGFKHSKETKLKMSEARQGNKHPLFGKPCTEERKNNISVSLKGKIPWNKGKKNVYSEETLMKMRQPKSKETRTKLSVIAKERNESRKRDKQGRYV